MLKQLLNQSMITFPSENLRLCEWNVLNVRKDMRLKVPGEACFNGLGGGGATFDFVAIKLTSVS